MKNGSLNVVSAKQLKELLTDITSSVADVLANTFGPYGQNTLIQQASSVYATKDGWNVMQTLKVIDKDGEMSVVANALKKLLQDVAQSVLLNAGDGTTTSTIAAAKLNTLISEYLEEHTLDARTIELGLRKCCELIENKLYERAFMVTDENMADIIYRIALISTNWDEEISGIIRDIYIKTKNPIIKVEDSGNLNTYADYIEGYDLVGHLELPNYCLTSPAKGLFEANHPLILTFGSAIHKDKLSTLALVEQVLTANNRKLVLVAPSYDLDFLNTLAAINGARVQQRQLPLNIVPFKYFAKTDIDKDCVEDFAMLTGSILLTHEYAEVETVFEKLKEVVAEQNNPTKKPNARAEKHQEEVVMECLEVLDKMGGTCEKIIANDKYILASGLTNKNTEEFERRKANLENELELKYKQCRAESSLTDMIRVKRLRLGKMQCSMGIIKIGGFGVAHLKSKKDSIDDATRACEVAYQDGYIVDGGMAIAIAANEALLEVTPDENDHLTYPFLRMFRGAFCEVAATLFNNKYDDLKKSHEIVTNCITNKGCYDLIRDEYTDDLITPVAVCREVLNGCLRLVLINATSNQFVFMNEDELIKSIRSTVEYETEEKEEEE